jgi:ferredoxin
LKVHVDIKLCQSHGECVLPAPDVFELGDDDVLQWKEDVDESRRAAVEDAANACPMIAIRIDG